MSKRQNDSDDDQRGHRFAGMRTQRACVKIRARQAGARLLDRRRSSIIGAQFVDSEELDGK